MDPLETFRRIYGQVPDWAEVMHEWAPEALRHYTALRMAVLEDGALARKDKELILVGINAARRYETSMLYHTQGAHDAGATAAEVAETVLTAVISRGLPAWLEGRKAVAFAVERERQMSGQTTVVAPSPAPAQRQMTTVEECEAYYRHAFGDIPGWASLMRDVQPDIFISYTNLRSACLRPGTLSPKVKELVLTGINAAERYPLGVEIHARGALEKGATRAELAECLLTAVLTAGIPAWFTGYSFLAGPDA
ncbi:carboxymuconolactone decarboxylase family protein [Alicyclobacillus sp.]|uniref:carboxymuconolactone decarboxylase family protein n=1 Tax=Alicyclobacillus sp. TaxID=61169 RepID=UPI0025B9F851|nr:carboxymuconolactone decarboxylase family protein [Alicyclobacillus sp.]MCL6516323.1 carboxymuconolactone decarboxylase family protein [Alicyclobacillus sp.]